MKEIEDDIAKKWKRQEQYNKRREKTNKSANSAWKSGLALASRKSGADLGSLLQPKQVADEPEKPDESELKEGGWSSDEGYYSSDDDFDYEGGK